MNYLRKRIKNKVDKIIKLATDISMSTEHDVWFSYSGHVNKFESCCVVGGFSAERRRCEVNLYLDSEKDKWIYQGQIKELNKYICELIKLKEGVR